MIAAFGPSCAATWRFLVDGHGPRQASRIFAKVLFFVELRGVDSVAKTLELALAQDTSPLLALAPAPDPSPTVAQDALPLSLQTIEIVSGHASDYDELFQQRGDS
jgi:hypothetical protein